jgi:hypothetical protein
MHSRPDQTQPRPLDEHIAQQDKQHLKSNAPRERAESDRKGTDDKLDELGQESFPASDPPAQP